jgi:REP element-mobilizing transposase RayT
MLTNLALFVTTRCDYPCAHYLRSLSDEKMDFPLEVLPGLLEQAWSFGARHVGFTDGEPHLHAILWPDEGVNLSDVLRDFKRHSSRTFSKTAVMQQKSGLLANFAAARQRGRAQEVSQYQVWQEGSHPEAIFFVEFARQKLDYIHNNPIRAGLATEAEDWPFSSAGAYYEGKVTFPPVDILALTG